MLGILQRDLPKNLGHGKDEILKISPKCQAENGRIPYYTNSMDHTVSNETVL